MNLKVKAQKWGNSLGMRIPKPIADELALTDGTVLELEIHGEDLIVHQSKKRKYELRDLLAQINSKNLHTEINSGEAVGEEIW